MSLAFSTCLVKADRLRKEKGNKDRKNKKDTRLGVFLTIALAGFEPTHDGTKNRCLTTWL